MLRTSLQAAPLMFLMCAMIQTAGAASKAEIDARVQETLQAFYAESSSGKALAEKAAGMLVFPSVVKAGIGIGGEFGEGALLVGNETAGYYNVAAASIGFQLGAQVKKQIILFMTPEALAGFRASSGWEAGVDGSVAVATVGAGGDITTENIKDPIIGFIFSNKGLMYDVSFEGSKITPVDK